MEEMKMAMMKTLARERIKSGFFSPLSAQTHTKNPKQSSMEEFYDFSGALILQSVFIRNKKGYLVNDIFNKIL